MLDRIVPARLYKYEGFNARSLENLKAQSIYFGPPKGFNDPYDCGVVPHIKEMMDSDVRLMLAACLDDPSISTAVRVRMESMSVTELRDAFRTSGIRILTERTNSFATNRGVTCFSEKNDDLLMWSHYGGRYKGFCLEFDTSVLPELKFTQVQYSEELPTINLVPILLNQGDNSEVMQMYTTKAKAWEYEREWRAFHQVGGTLYGYPMNALTGVYFGPEMGTESLEIICLILQGQNNRVRFWRGSRSSTQFKVEFEEVYYRSLVESQKLSLYGPC